MSAVFGAFANVLGSAVSQAANHESNFQAQRAARKQYGKERDDNRENARMARDWAREDWEKAQRWARQDAAKVRQQNLDDYATVRADKLQDNEQQFVRTREAAEAAGFNPLTALGVPLANAGAAGIASSAPVASQAAATPSIQGAVHQAGRYAPLASTSLLVEGIKELGDVITGEDARNTRIAKANAELADLRVDAARALVGVPQATGNGYGGGKLTRDVTTEYAPRPTVLDAQQSHPVRQFFVDAKNAAQEALTAGPFQADTTAVEDHDMTRRKSPRTGRIMKPEIEEETGTRVIAVTPYGSRNVYRGDDISEMLSNFGKEKYAQFKNWEDKRTHAKQQKALKEINRMKWEEVATPPPGLGPLARTQFYQGKVVTHLATGKRYRLKK